MASLQSQLTTLQNKLNNYGTYAYKDSGLQAAYKTAQNAYNSLYNNMDKYLDLYRSDVDELFEQVMNPEKFTYDTRKDQLFQMYKRQYDKQGRRAMDNAMAIGAARNGGNLSSISQQSGQSQYLNYMDALNDKAAETYANALSRYQQKQSDLLNRYNVASDMNNASNEAFYNKLNVAGQHLNNAQSAWLADDDRQYRSWSDQRTFMQTQAKDIQDQINANRSYNLQKKLRTG